MSIQLNLLQSSLAPLDTARMFKMVMFERAWGWAAEFAG